MIRSISSLQVGISLIKPATIPQDQAPESIAPSCITFGYTPATSSIISSILRSLPRFFSFLSNFSTAALFKTEEALGLAPPFTSPVFYNPDVIVWVVTEPIRDLQPPRWPPEAGLKDLEKYFVQDVLGPIKYHVKAKRYLAREENYYKLLSKASKISLKIQGGVMSNEESKKFENNEFFESSIKLRKFDEMAKKSGLKIKSINEYKKLLISKLI